jgi:hypothetical protein
VSEWNWELSAVRLKIEDFSQSLYVRLRWSEQNNNNSMSRHKYEGAIFNYRHDYITLACNEKQITEWTSLQLTIIQLVCVYIVWHFQYFFSYFIFYFLFFSSSLLSSPIKFNFYCLIISNRHDNIVYFILFECHAISDLLNSFHLIS